MKENQGDKESKLSEAVSLYKGIVNSVNSLARLHPKIAIDCVRISAVVVDLAPSHFSREALLQDAEMRRN